MALFPRRLSVLIFHRVIEEPDPLVPDQICAAEFDVKMRLLRRWFNVLPLREAASRLRAGTLPARAASVTFDDGYADNATIALPILRRRGVPATFFVATGFLNGGRMWNDTAVESVRIARGNTLDAGSLGLPVLDISSVERRRKAIGEILGALKYLPVEEREMRVQEFASAAGLALESELMMTADQVRHLHASGMEIGAHTVRHPILAKLDPTRAADEIGESKRVLEAITNAPVTLFAYPNGKPGVDYLREHVTIVKQAGFEAAVSTATGVSVASSDPYQLPRFTPWDRTQARFLLRMLQNATRTNAVTV